MAEDLSILCPYCGEKIRAEATKCRFCHQWLVRRDSDGQAPTPPRRRKLGFAILLIVIAGLSATGIWRLGQYLERIREQERRADTYGLVLAGGCAKGAYEVGVWKALQELKIAPKVRVISGTSIGAVNAALFGTIGQENAKSCEDIWLNKVEKMFVIDQDAVFRVIARFVKGAIFKPEGGSLMWNQRNVAVSGNSYAPGACDSRPLRKLLQAYLPANLADRPPYIYTTALAKDSKQLHRFLLNGKSSSRYLDCIMASAAVPYLFSSVPIDGVNYVDGGFGCEDWNLDNVPLAPIRDRHPEVGTVIVVYLEGADELTRRWLPEDFPSGRLIEIIPSRNIDTRADGSHGALDFSRKTVADLIQLGYDDTLRVMTGVRTNSVDSIQLDPAIIPAPTVRKLDSRRDDAS